MPSTSFSNDLQTILPVDPCHDCGQRAAVVVVPAVTRHSGWECSVCRAVRWNGVTMSGGSLVIALRDVYNNHVCWRCRESYTLPELSIPDLPYLKGPIAFIFDDDSNYKNDHHCAECGQLITKEKRA